MFCPKCGAKNQDNNRFCLKCGNELNLAEPQPPKKSVDSDRSQVKADPSQDKNPSTILLVLGYIFALLGGLIGIAIGAYLYTKKNPDAQYHGRNIILIALVIMILGFLSSALLISNITEPSSVPVENLKAVVLNESRDNSGDLILEGEVVNIGNKDINSVTINATAFDSDGNIIATDNTISNPSIIPAGGKATFTVKFNDKNREIVRYSIIANAKLN
ncbi:MAG: FxLYD domain-containing protein [Methanobacteriaceae archaeon]|nr:FxLYD domain-containing protein [Methanobacteriaceae archaeon]